jgi:hypothetical protein
MISSERVLTVVAALGLYWQESCGDPTLFCYRVVSGAVAPLRERRGRNDAAPCSIPSDCCTTSTTSKA